jgi:TonB family protein
MATDSARVQLELASGRNEITAPFLQTAQRRRQQLELDAASVDAPVDQASATQFAFDVPLATRVQPAEAPVIKRPTAAHESRSTARPPWVAFIAALLVVGVGVWWVMSQRMPDIDVRQVITRNLSDADTAMADGRYTDPPERSAFHYYSTVLALDPKNTDAIAGIDAIADRHLTNARVLLADRKLAEAGVALEKVRRVRPEHVGLAALDSQWRDEIRRLLVASAEIAKPTTEPVTIPAVSKPRASAPRREAPKIENLARTAPEVKSETTAPTRETDLSAITAALTPDRPSKPLDAMAGSPAPEPPPSSASPPSESATIAGEAATAAPLSAAAAPSGEPKLIKMIQPVYPPEALMRGLEGWVDVSLQVSPSGDVLAPRVEESSRGRMFNRAALTAVEQWKYEPRSDGTTSERMRVRLRFQQSN